MQTNADRIYSSLFSYCYFCECYPNFGVHHSVEAVVQLTGGFSLIFFFTTYSLISSISYNKFVFKTGFSPHRQTRFQFVEPENTKGLRGMNVIRSGSLDQVRTREPAPHTTVPSALINCRDRDRYSVLCLLARVRCFPRRLADESLSVGLGAWRNH